ncbi:MAG: FAD-dependent oxidoreductase [Salibacteraceae bacterium]
MGNYLIIGAGLAGISLAERFLEHNHTIKVVDKVDDPSSTQVATGMANPIVFKRLNKSWLIDVLVPEAHAFYSKLETKLNAKLLEPIDLRKRITSKDYASFWNKRAKEEEYEAYLSPIKCQCGPVKQAFSVDCKSLQSAYLRSLESSNMLINTDFDHSHIDVAKGNIVFQDQVFDAVIFCEGAYAVYNPLWNWLPFKVAKGDWVEIELEKEIADFVLNNVVNVIPLGNKRYKLSSSFEWDTMDWGPSPSAREELLNSFSELFNIPYKVVDQRSGLRPAASDRRPFLGEHPRKPGHYIFNGFGSKGVLLAPYFSQHLYDHITMQSDLMKEVNVKRHLKRFQAQNQ